MQFILFKLYKRKLLKNGVTQHLQITLFTWVSSIEIVSVYIKELTPISMYLRALRHVYLMQKRLHCGFQARLTVFVLSAVLFRTFYTNSPRESLLLCSEPWSIFVRLLSDTTAIEDTFKSSLFCSTQTAVRLEVKPGAKKKQIFGVDCATDIYRVVHVFLKTAMC